MYFMYKDSNFEGLRLFQKKKSCLLLKRIFKIKVCLIIWLKNSFSVFQNKKLVLKIYNIIWLLFHVLGF